MCWLESTGLLWGLAPAGREVRLAVLVYSTCPTTARVSPEAFRQQLADVAGWAERAGLRGLLIFTDNEMIDPWAAAQHIMERTERVVPLVAVQPLYLHPYSAARNISTLAHLYGRRVDLNFVTGGNRRDFQALGCTIDHDERYARLVEFGKIMLDLLDNPERLTHSGKYYQLDGANLQPAMSPDLLPMRFLAGSSPVGIEAARALDAVRLTYPLALEQYDDSSILSGAGIRLGIIARETSEEAWQVAHRLFPPDRVGEAKAKFLVHGVESQWWHRLRQEPVTSGATYWLYPFHSFKTFCPYLVGSYREVGETIARYLGLGVSTLILGESYTEDDLFHAQLALQHADRVGAQHPL